MRRLSCCRYKTFLKKKVMVFFQADSSACKREQHGGTHERGGEVRKKGGSWKEKGEEESTHLSAIFEGEETLVVMILSRENGAHVGREARQVRDGKFIFKRGAEADLRAEREGNQTCEGGNGRQGRRREGRKEGKKRGRGSWGARREDRGNTSLPAGQREVFKEDRSIVFLWEVCTFPLPRALTPFLPPSLPPSRLSPTFMLSMGRSI
jgi:hypothetical protein